MRLIHLSDIHFRREISGGPYDLDSDVRNELGRDLSRELCAPASGILITGDIAFSGKSEEYATARTWIEDLCHTAGCLPSVVYTVPGNHDIDRDIIDDSDTIREMHTELRGLEGVSLDRALAKAMGDRVRADGLLRPLGAYNDFALRYGCNVSPDQLWWEDNLELNDHSLLRIRGLTSVIVSDRYDDKGTSKLLLGTYQVTLPREDGVEYVTLCHHPQDWLIDSDTVEDALRRARMRLFGHKHRFRYHRVDDSLVLTAGATHPDRAESQWQPRYNIIDLEVEKSAERRFLIARINARVWDDNHQAFKPDVDLEGGSPHEFRLPLPDWSPPVLTAVEASIEASPLASEPAVSDQTKMDSTTPARRPERELLYRFLSLPYQRQQRMALELGLIAENERFPREADLWQAVFTRARDKGRLNEFWEVVSVATPDLNAQTNENPFDVRRQEDE